jgi:bifunctional DNase/RNase
VALAVRADVPIFVSDTVMELAAIEPDPGSWLDGESEPTTGEELSAFRDFIDSLDLGDLGD